MRFEEQLKLDKINIFLDSLKAENFPIELKIKRINRVKKLIEELINDIYEHYEIYEDEEEE